jgi:hypothetical protein
MAPAAPLRSWVRFPTGMNFRLEGKKIPSSVPHQSTGLWSSRLTGMQVPLYMGGAGVQGFSRAAWEFIFLMKHCGNISPPVARVFFRLILEILLRWCWFYSNSHYNVREVEGQNLLLKTLSPFKTCLTLMDGGSTILWNDGLLWEKILIFETKGVSCIRNKNRVILDSWLLLSTLEILFFFCL